MSETAKNYGSIYDLPLQNASALAPEIEKRTVYGPEGGVWKDYVMRHFILPPHRGIPAHVHDWDHLMFTLSGDGVVEVEEEPDIPLEFFCIVPTCGDPHAKKYAMRAERAARKEAEKDGE